MAKGVCRNAEWATPRPLPRRNRRGDLGYVRDKPGRKKLRWKEKKKKEAAKGKKEREGEGEGKEEKEEKKEEKEEKEEKEKELVREGFEPP